jgi:hypothetical protein
MVAQEARWTRQIRFALEIATRPGGGGIPYDTEVGTMG